MARPKTPFQGQGASWSIPFTGSAKGRAVVVANPSSDAMWSKIVILIILCYNSMVTRLGKAAWAWARLYSRAYQYTTTIKRLIISVKHVHS